MAKNDQFLSLIRENVPVYIERVATYTTTFGLAYQKGTLFYQEDENKFWMAIDYVKPYQCLDTIEKLLFSTSAGEPVVSDDDKVALFNGDTHGYLTEKVTAGSGISLSLIGVAPNQYLRIDNTYTAISTFLGLSDTPSSYSGQGGKLVAVKSDGSGLEFKSPKDAGKDENVKVSLQDPVSAYLKYKIIAGAGVTINEVLATGNSTGNYLLITATGSAGGFQRVVSIGDGTKTVFTVTGLTDLNNLLIFVSGTLMHSGYTRSGSQVTFASAPWDGSPIMFIF